MPKRTDIQTALIMGAGSWSELQADVLAAVKGGRIGISDPDRITWSPPDQWRERFYRCIRTRRPPHHEPHTGFER